MATSSAHRAAPTLHVVTGKGGVGKTTVAAALALALAAEGQDVLLCEVEGRQGIARLFDVDELPYAERRVATGLSNAEAAPGAVHALHIDAESALLEYLQMYYKLGRAGRVLDRFGVIDFATTVAPGVRDVLLTGKLYEAVNRNPRNREARGYDAVVLDAPPTGRVGAFLNVTSELAGLAKVGPIKSQSDRVQQLMHSAQTVVHLVTLLEEMPVQETAEAVAELRGAGLRVGAIIANRVRPARSGRQPSPETLAADLDTAGLSTEGGLVQTLLDLGARDHERRELQSAQRAVLQRLDVPAVELPDLPDGVDLGGLYALAAALEEHLAALGGRADARGDRR